jgi:hypothetical protein
LDRVLRGEATRGGAVAVSARRLAAVSGLLGFAYGLCMGVFGVFNQEEPEFRLLFNGMFKVPALFLLTLAVTFPSLYMFNALVGSRLTPTALGRLLAAGLGVTLAVLASFGPIVAFFSVTTTSYPFILLLNVAVFALAGLLGMGFFMRTLYRLSAAPVEPPAAPGDVPTVLPAPVGEPQVKGVFAIWLVVFAVVGAQMSWVLRPFVGSPDLPFTWFRPRMSSFFEAVLDSLRRLLS